MERRRCLSDVQRFPRLLAARIINATHKSRQPDRAVGNSPRDPNEAAPSMAHYRANAIAFCGIYEKEHRSFV